MDWIRKIVFCGCIVIIAITLKSCAVSFKFNGTSIDYSKIKTISIAEFPNKATLVYPPVAIQLNEALQDIYRKQTNALCINILESGHTAQYTLFITFFAASMSSCDRHTLCTRRICSSYGAGFASARRSRKYFREDSPVTGGVLMPDLLRFSYMAPEPLRRRSSSS